MEWGAGIELRSSSPIALPSPEVVLANVVLRTQGPMRADGWRRGVENNAVDPRPQWAYRSAVASATSLPWVALAPLVSPMAMHGEPSGFGGKVRVRLGDFHIRRCRYKLFTSSRQRQGWRRFLLLSPQCSPPSPRPRSGPATSPLSWESCSSRPYPVGFPAGD